MKILVFAPHPDDEVLGCGGTMAKLSEDKDNEVFLCIATNAYEPEWSREFIENRPNEVYKAMKIMGIKGVIFLDFPTVKMDTLPKKKVNDAVASVVKEVSPDMVMVPHKGDLNNDHRILFDAVMVASRPVNSNVKTIMCYETLSETEWGEPFVPNCYVDISGTITKKLSAMMCYGSEVRTPPHPRSLEIIKALAMKRGSEVNLPFAEAFLIIRDVR